MKFARVAVYLDSDDRLPDDAPDKVDVLHSKKVLKRMSEYHGESRGDEPYILKATPYGVLARIHPSWDTHPGTLYPWSRVAWAELEED